MSNARSSVASKTAPTAVLEYGHVYLQERKPNKSNRLDPSLVTALDDYLTTRGFDVTSLLIIDDTTQVPQEFGSEAFETTRDEFTATYLEMLSPTPDRVVFESEFEPVIDHLIDQFPVVTNGDLDENSGWGYRIADQKAYVYGPGPNRPKVKVRDETADSSKSRPYTCAMYDTAITLAKLSSSVSIPSCPTGSVSVTVHDSGYLDSHTLTESHILQDLLVDNEMVDWSGQHHYEIPETHEAVDTLTCQLEETL